MFEDNLSVKFGRILFENRTAQELYDVAQALYHQFRDSNFKDETAGYLALDVAIAAFFEGELKAADVIMYCSQKILLVPDRVMHNLVQSAYCEAGAAVSSSCACEMYNYYSKGTSPLTPQNDYSAAMWLEKAAAMGHIRAQSKMGILYSNGKGVDKDYEKAKFWWLKSAENGFVDAQYNLGNLFLGRMDDAPRYMRDIQQAGYWLSMAAQNGEKQAQALLDYYLTYNKFTKRWKEKD